MVNGSGPLSFVEGLLCDLRVECVFELLLLSLTDCIRLRSKVSPVVALLLHSGVVNPLELREESLFSSDASKKKFYAVTFYWVFFIWFNIYISYLVL